MFGRHYAETLRLWRRRFTAQAGSVDALGFDQIFRRTWDFYLAYSEAGFRTGYLDVAQLVLERSMTAVAAPTDSTATELARLFRIAVGIDMPIRLRCWDRSRSTRPTTTRPTTTLTATLAATLAATRP